MQYAAITPVRDEIEALPRLAASLIAQHDRPAPWVIVDNGSQDGTLAYAEQLAADQPWIRVLSIPPAGPLARGAASVRAFTAGLRLIDTQDIVVQLDADVSLPPAYFRVLLAAFADDPQLGIASGVCHEQRRGQWRLIPVTGDSVWGATRAYRRACLDRVLPLEPRIGWDGIDQLKANAYGWRTGTIASATFFHHRPEGSRDGSDPAAPWIARGRTAYYMGYRPWYLALRTARHLWTTRHAVAMWRAFAAARRAGEPVCDDPIVVAALHRDQALATLPRRMRQLWSQR